MRRAGGRRGRLLGRLPGALAAAALVGLMAAGTAWGDTIVLFNGEEIFGEVVDVTSRDVVLRVGGQGRMRIQLREVQDIQLRHGDSIWEERVQQALAGIHDELRREAEERLRRRGLAPEPVVEPAEPEIVEPGEPTPEVRAISFGGQYESALYGFRVQFPVQWQAEQAEPDYFVFQDERPEARALWKFNATVFQRFEVDTQALQAKAAAELEQLADYDVRSRGRTRVGGNIAERTVGVFEQDDLAIHHEQVIVATARGYVLVFQFFAPGVTSGRVPEIEAVIRSIELLP